MSKHCKTCTATQDATECTACYTSHTEFDCTQSLGWDEPGPIGGAYGAWYNTMSFDFVGCGEGGYLDPFQDCQACPANCLRCSDSTTCLHCEPGYTLNAGSCDSKCKRYIMEACNDILGSIYSECAACSAPYPTGTCQACIGGFQLGGNCVSNCPAQTYPSVTFTDYPAL